LDSVTANYRAEFDRPTLQKVQSQPAQMAQRSKDLRKLAGTVKDLAIQWNVAVITVNQVTDTFKRSSQGMSCSQEDELLALDYQGRWFDGVIDEYGENSKRPALGLVWSNLICSRIMLVKDNPFQNRIKVVFSPFARPGSLVYGISSVAGVHSIDMHPGKSEDVLPREECVEEYVLENVESDFELKTDDLEFSDSGFEEVLSGQTND
jgi:Rad51